MNTKRNVHKLGRKKSHRDALKKNLLTSLVLYEHVTTTRARAKALVPLFDRLISDAKRGGHLAERSLEQSLFDENAIRKVMEVLVTRFKDENSGLVRQFKVGNRPGDNSAMVKLMVKGYEYKEIGKKQAKKQVKEKKSETAKQTRNVPAAVNEDTRSSQVKGSASQGKAKSRSGI